MQKVYKQFQKKLLVVVAKTNATLADIKSAMCSFLSVKSNQFCCFG